MSDPAASFLSGFEFHRLRQTPLDDDPRLVSGQLVGALTAAHATLQGSDDAKVLVAWDRPAGQRQVRVLVGGDPFFPPARRVGAVGTGLRPVLYPPGSLASAVDTEELGYEWAALPAWTRCSGQADALLLPESDRSDPENPGRGRFDDNVAHLPGPFAWLVGAEPLSVEAVDRELVDLEIRLPRLRARVNSEPDRIGLARAEGRFRELSRAANSGVWQVHVLVGSDTAENARSAAALLCAASDLDQLPYALTPGRECATLAETWAATVPAGPGARGSSPFSGSNELVAAIARPPRRELPGIRLVERPAFDVTPEVDGDIHLGSVLDDADLPVGEFAVGLDTLNRHAFVAGATGSGKSQTVRHLLEGLHDRGIPWLVIEPAKAEYARVAGRLGSRGEVLVLRPGAPDAVPVGLNPLEPEPGFPLQTHLDLTRALFMAAFEAAEPFPQVLSHALTRCYTDLGWDPVTGDATRPGGALKYPSLGDLQRTALAVVEEVGYGPEVQQNVRGFIDVRIGSLRLGTPGRFFEGGHPLDITELLGRNVVLEIEDIGSDTDKAFFIGAILIRLFEHLRNQPASERAGLRHVTVIEEAHRLLKRTEPGSPSAHAVELFTSLLAEIRAYGEGIVVAEQIPSKIVPDVIKNTACKILHRLPADDDRDSVGATMNLDEAQSRHVVTLPPGRAAVFTDGMDRPIRLQMPLGEGVEDATKAVDFVHTTRHRSPACGVGCQTEPCTLRQLNQASRRADDHPELILWIELLTIAHLVGRPVPQPDRVWLDRLISVFGERGVACAIAHRIQTAVDARDAKLSVHYPPESLAAQLAASAQAALWGPAHARTGPDPQGQAGAFRWADVRMELKRSLDATVASADGRHPHTDAWARRGLILTGTTIADQLMDLDTRRSIRQADHALFFGPGHTALDTAVSALTTEGAFNDRLTQAAGFLNPGRLASVVTFIFTATDGGEG